ncbi:MAG: succinyldiaminopimelate transaminase [Gammaproteobacteria bacterium]|jgi:N-succinyldiaminopimelate aminotransferase
MNPDLARLQPYPFERLAALKAGVTPPAGLSHIPLSIGEPRHAPPQFVLDALTDNLSGLGAYPMARGLGELREAIAGWLARRFDLGSGGIDPERHVLPVTGTREALFAFAQAVVERGKAPMVLMPNPFYQIYEGAALLAGAEPGYLNCTAENGYLPDLDAVPDTHWQRCQLLYLCSPGNPTGAVMDSSYLRRVIELADRHDFIIASDECYSEIYADDSRPPVGLLQVCRQMGRDDFNRCIVFHSLSKRSNVPGLRSGFVAGDARIIEKFLLYRTYHGCAAPIPAQLASVPAWQDDAHVAENRERYRNKFDATLPILSKVMEVERPEGAFYLWPRTPIDAEDFTRRLFAECNVTVIPGTYLSRPGADGDPGAGRIRISLVASVDECVEAAQRIHDFTAAL